MTTSNLCKKVVLLFVEKKFSAKKGPKPMSERMSGGLAKLPPIKAIQRNISAFFSLCQKK